MHLQENESKKWWKVTVNLAEVSLQNAHMELEHNFDDTEYVIVCQPPNGIKQALFVDKYNAKKKVVTSSDVDDQGQTRVNIGDILNVYKVTCTAEDANKIGEQKYSEDIKYFIF